MIDQVISTSCVVFFVALAVFMLAEKPKALTKYITVTCLIISFAIMAIGILIEIWS